jgi:hypothetical protein
MSGYTPVFSTVFTGTLHGRWPDTGLWLCLLAMADKHGLIDCTPQYIAGVTGLSAEDVIGCIERFTRPDPYSRSQDEEGRRLIPIDPARPWGWRIVNHGKYREKARLQSRDSQRTESGADAKRKRKSPEVPRIPPLSPSRPLSDADADSNKEKRGMEKRAARAPIAHRLPENFELTPQRQATAKAEAVNPEREFARFCDHWRAASGANARKLDWDAAWRNWCRKAGDFRKPQGTASEPVRTWEPPEDEHATP